MTTSLSRTGELTAIAFAIACTGATFSIFALPVAAKDYPIVVAPLTEMETWTKDINRSLNRRLEQTTTGDARGIVQLRFMLDEEGHPENILMTGPH